MSAKQCTHVHVHAYTPEPGILGSMKRVRVCHLCYVLGVMCYVPQPLEQRCSYSFELESLEGEAVCVLGGGGLGGWTKRRRPQALGWTLSVQGQPAVTPCCSFSFWPKCRGAVAQIRVMLSPALSCMGHSVEPHLPYLPRAQSLTKVQLPHDRLHSLHLSPTLRISCSVGPPFLGTHCCEAFEP